MLNRAIYPDRLLSSGTRQVLKAVRRMSDEPYTRKYTRQNAQSGQTGEYKIILPASKNILPALPYTQPKYAQHAMFEEIVRNSSFCNIQ